MSQYYTPQEQGTSGLTIFAWILVIVFAIATIVFAALYFTKKPKDITCPKSPVPDDVDVKNDTVVIYDRVGPNDAEGRRFENTYFKNVLFKCSGLQVPDSQWATPFDVPATVGNQKGIDQAFAPSDKGVTNSNGSGSEEGAEDVQDTSNTPPQGGESFKSISNNRIPPHRYPFW